jgi:hypothetical protein|tara:strand:- start:15928 stop:16329 length:402 start_codon:yes stop_codon:yes gene_type:complete
MSETRLTVIINKEIGIPEWERFEQLADEKKELWRIFWAISNDKAQIKKDKICPIAYFNKFVMDSLEVPMREFITESDDGIVINKSDIETILSLYVKLIPQNQCEICGKETSFIDKLNKHYECPHLELDEIMKR